MLQRTEARGCEALHGAAAARPESSCHGLARPPGGEREMKKIDALLDFASEDGVILFGAAVAYLVFLAL
jgi:hypothetical protein